MINLKYYGWMSFGYFVFPNKEDGEYRWDYKRPRRSTMARLYKMMGKDSYAIKNLDKIKKR